MSIRLPTKPVGLLVGPLAVMEAPDPARLFNGKSIPIAARRKQAT